jgi:AGCS family alanine or glycine:cation symporter
MEQILDFALKIDEVLWGPWTLLFIAAVAVYLTVRSGFFQLRGFRLIWKNTIGKLSPRADRPGRGMMTPFQATTTALASTVGMGNIAGVATALSIGGPGAIFWMWLLALLGMMTKTVEITLAVHYREVDEKGNLHGGPMYYINKALGWRFLAKLFSFGILINALLTATLIQSHTVGRAFFSSYGLSPYVMTALMAVVTGIVIIGGIRRIGRFCEKLVPIMSILYFLVGLALLVINASKIPEVFTLIFKHAFSAAPAVGGFAGATVAKAIQRGMSRGMLSNEAGLGTAPMAHATAATPHPFQQGIWGAFEVFVDTIIICTITSFAVISTGVLSGGESGIELVIAAFSSVFPEKLAAALLSASILTFCLTTQIGFFIYYENAVLTVFGKKAIRYLKWFYLLPGVVFAGVANVDKLWVFADISVAVCSLPNLVAILALSGAFFKLMRDYLEGKNVYATAVVDAEKNYVFTKK